MLQFERKRVPVPAGLAELMAGHSVELVELTFGEKEAATENQEGRKTAYALLGASLHVDGQSLGLDGLYALPASWMVEIAETLDVCVKLHRLGQRTKEEQGNA